MRGRYRWAALWAVAVAVWMSDRWLWMVPGLLGVLGGVRLARYRAGSAADLQLGERFGSLLILAGMVYLYVVLIALEWCRWRALVDESELPQHPPLLLISASTVVLLALLAWGALLLLRLPPPRWLLRLWAFLLQPR